MDLLLQQTTLARFGELALRSDDLDEVLTEACRLAAEALGTDLAEVDEFQDRGRTLLMRSGVGWSSGIVGVTRRAPSEGEALVGAEPVISPDIATETRFAYSAFLIRNGVRSFAKVPIIGGRNGPHFGVLQVSSRSPHRFTDNDAAFLRIYAALLAATVSRLQINGEVRDGEERFRLALEAGELGSWDIDLLGGTATHTPRFDAILGQREAPAAWSYADFLDYVLADDRERVDLAFACAVETRTDWHVQCRICRAGDGGLRWIEVHGRPHGPQGRPTTHIQGIIADITERKRNENAMRLSHDVLEARVFERTRDLSDANARLLREAEDRRRIEDALRQSQKMEAVGQLTGGIAHDFNNALTGIVGGLDLIRKRVAQRRFDELDRSIDLALASADRAAALTHRLLAFSRRQPLLVQRTDVNEAVASLEDLLRRTVGSAILINTRLCDAPWPTLCDPNQLENALVNLAINARDAMPEGGRIFIETHNASLSEARGVIAGVPGGDFVVLAVSDEGTGMTPEVMARAFDPFFTTKPVGLGTGLGLSMIYGFVRQSGGQIALRKAQGGGLAVVISLPRDLGMAPASVDVDAMPGSPTPTADAGVLVAERQPAVLTVAADGLTDVSMWAIRRTTAGPVSRSWPPTTESTIGG